MLKPPEIKVIILSTSTKANGFNGYFLTLCNSNPKSKTMKAHFLLLAIACMLLSSCVKEKNTSAACHYDKPLEQIEWLRTVKNDLESSSISSEIYSYNFGGNDYFQINYCKNCFDSGFTIYDCNRKVICDQGGWAGPNQCKSFLKLASNKKLLYSK